MREQWMNEMRCRRVYYVNHVNVLLEQLSLSHVCVRHNASRYNTGREFRVLLCVLYMCTVYTNTHMQTQKGVLLMPLQRVSARVVRAAAHDAYYSTCVWLGTCAINYWASARSRWITRSPTASGGFDAHNEFFAPKHLNKLIEQPRDAFNEWVEYPHTIKHVLELSLINLIPQAAAWKAYGIEESRVNINLSKVLIHFCFKFLYTRIWSMMNWFVTLKS